MSPKRWACSQLEKRTHTTMNEVVEELQEHLRIQEQFSLFRAFTVYLLLFWVKWAHSNITVWLTCIRTHTFCVVSCWCRIVKHVIFFVYSLLRQLVQIVLSSVNLRYGIGTNLWTQCFGWFSFREINHPPTQLCLILSLTMKPHHDIHSSFYDSCWLSTI